MRDDMEPAPETGRSDEADEKRDESEDVEVEAVEQRIQEEKRGRREPSQEECRSKEEDDKAEDLVAARANQGRASTCTRCVGIFLLWKENTQDNEE